MAHRAGARPARLLGRPSALGEPGGRRSSRAELDQEELAQLCALALPLLGREPLFHLHTEAGPRGYPLVAVDGERGPVECGGLALYEPELASALHLLQGLARSPAALAGLIEAAGPGALAQVGRILAARL